MAITEFLPYTCDLVIKTEAWRNEYNERFYSRVTQTIKCYIDYPDIWYNDSWDSKFEIEYDALLFTEPLTDIKVNSIITNILDKNSNTVDDREYTVYNLSSLWDDNGLHHYEITLKLKNDWS